MTPVLVAPKWIFDGEAAEDDTIGPWVHVPHIVTKPGADFIDAPATDEGSAS